MSAEEWLDQVGQEYLTQVEAEEPQFLIEIDVPDARLKDIFASIGKARPYHWTPQKRICLALAAVHSAAQADENEDSFREMFYKRLDRQFNLTEWDSVYGPAISEFLGGWFSVDVPTSGPYRYVGTVYRHAGIPVPARSGFCLLVVGLLQNGLAFTRNQYDDAVQRVPSSVARCFLESDSGYEFTKQTARTILRLDHGQISREELEAFPSYRRLLYEVALNALHRVPNRSRLALNGSYPPPTLGLDVTARRLVIQFDPQGVNANVYRTAKGAVYYATHAVSGTEPPVYSIRPETEWAELRPWWSPGLSQSALFRAGDCALAGNSGIVAPGRYYLVTSVPDSIPKDFILEDSGTLKARTPMLSRHTTVLFYLTSRRALESGAFHSRPGYGRSACA